VQKDYGAIWIRGLSYAHELQNLPECPRNPPPVIYRRLYKHKESDNKMKISIVMAVYNGEKYILEQLESIRKQSRKPDEVIISDDCSTDSTEDIIKSYIDKHNLKGWKYKSNPGNVGWQKNFMCAIGEATGEIIFTCDQDDVWYSFKLECMEQIMAENSEIMLLASDYDLKYKVHDFHIDAKKLKKNQFTKKFMYVYRPGCTYCFRKSLYDTARKYWFEGCPHDALMWRYANIIETLYIYSEPLIFYRRHSETATGNEKKTVASKLESMSCYLKAIDSLKDVASDTVNGTLNKTQYRAKCREWAALRIEFLRSWKFILWLRLGLYISYYYNIKSYFADLIMRLLLK